MTIKDYNRYRKAILGAVSLVITLLGIGIYFVTNEKEEAFNNTAPSIDASDSTIEPENYRLMTAPWNNAHDKLYLNLWRIVFALIRQ